MRPLLLALLLAGCASRERADAVADTVSYYRGQAQQLAPDGERPIGSFATAVKRVVSPERGVIVETVLQPGRRGGLEARELGAVLTRVPGTGRFEVDSESGGFKGAIEFSGVEWNWDRWTYDLRLKDGGRLKGEGERDREGIRTTKRVFNETGNPVVIVKEDLRVTDAEEYGRLKREWGLK